MPENLAYPSPQAQNGLEADLEHFTLSETDSVEPNDFLAESGANAINRPTTEVELRLSCSGLEERGKCDPQMIVFVKQKLRSTNSKVQTVWRQVGKTEVLINASAPNFTTPIILDYYFEKVQTLCIVIIQVDNPTNPSNNYIDHTLVGCCVATLGEIIASSRVKSYSATVSSTLPTDLASLFRTMPIKRTTSVIRRFSTSGTAPKISAPPTIQILAEEIRKGTQSMTILLSARDLEKRDKLLFGGNSDVFFEIQRPRDDSVTPWVTVYRSEQVSKDGIASWKPLSIRLDLLCYNDMDRILKICLFDYGEEGKHVLLGSAGLSARKMLETSKDETPISLIQQETSDGQLMRRGSKSRSSGQLLISRCAVTNELTFLDYIASGTEIALTIGIDFTGSNGSMDNPCSLHHMPKDDVSPIETDNPYQMAIKSVGSVLEVYDTDKVFPVYGFGLKSTATGEILHCHPLNGRPTSPEIKGIPNVLKAYSDILTNGFYQLWGPTHFAPLIRSVNQRIEGELSKYDVQSQGLIRYHILLIITDGLVADMDATLEAIVTSSRLPLSIVIVGVGEQDFGPMRFLDGDGKLLKDRKGQLAERDCVQFLPLKAFASMKSETEAIANETLAEIPEQFLSWVNKRNVGLASPC